MRVQYTVRDVLAKAMKLKADSLGIPVGRLVESYLEQAVVRNEAVRLEHAVTALQVAAFTGADGSGKPLIAASTTPAVLPSVASGVNGHPPSCAGCGQELEEGVNTDVDGGHANCPALRPRRSVGQ